MLQHCVITLCVLLRGRRVAFFSGEDARPPAAAAAGSVEPHIPAISTLLAQPALSCHDLPEVQLASVEAARELVEAVAHLGEKPCMMRASQM